MKKSSDSKSILSEVMLPGQANPAGTVHGGEIMKMMDTCGSVAAMRHAKKTVVTVRVDELVFYQPIQVGQLVVCEAELVFVGRTSMEVLVTVKYENMTDDEPCRVALTAYFTYVAIDENRKPCPVPGLLTDTEEEKKAFELGRQRYEDHKRKGK